MNDKPSDPWSNYNPFFFNKNFMILVKEEYAYFPLSERTAVVI